MRESGCVALDVPLATRVGLLREEYGHFEQDPGLLRAQLDCLVELHGREKVASWKALAHAQQWDRMVEQLLTDHYDPAYRRSIARNFKESATAARLAIISADSAAYTAAAQSLVR
jgi:tRNA 2-selenouridine synthase